MGRPWPTLGRSATKKKPSKINKKAQYGKKNIHMKILDIETDYFLSNFPYYFPFHPLEDTAVLISP